MLTFWISSYQDVDKNTTGVLKEIYSFLNEIYSAIEGSVLVDREKDTRSE